VNDLGFSVILIILLMTVIVTAVVYFTKHLRSEPKKQEENKDLVKEVEGETKKSLIIGGSNVRVTGGSGFRPKECQSCGRYIIEPLEIYDSKNNVKVKVCPYCEKRI
jgi:hypothetical protein